MTGYVVAMATLLGGIVKRNSKMVSGLMLLAMWLLMGFNSHNADYAAYQAMYNFTMTRAGSGIPIGYWILICASRTIGLNFVAFRAICCGIGLLNIYLLVSRYTRDGAFVLAAYMICPFFYDIVQFRFFFASSIAIVGTIFLIEGKRTLKLFFAVFVLVASTIHPACTFFLVFYITCLTERRAALASCVVALGILMATYTGLTASLASLVMDDVKASLYLSSMGRLGFLPYWGSIFLSALFVTGTMRSGSHERDSEGRALLHGNTDDSIDVRVLMFDEFARKAVYTMLPLGAILPLSVQNFYRPIRSSLIIINIYCSNVFYGSERQHVSATARELLFVIYWVWLALTAYTLFYDIWDVVIITELESNLLW